MKKRKIVITIAIILIVAVLMFTSFFGLYIKNENNEKRNIFPDYKMGMEFTTSRRITATVSDEIASQTIYDAEGNEITEQEEGVEYTEENGYRIEEVKVNPDDIRTLDNYKKSKDVLKEKLDNLDVSQYNLMLNESNGEIIIEIPENDKTDSIKQSITTPGSLVFFDSSTFEMVFDNTYIKDSQVVTSQGDLEAGVFLQITPTEEGVNKIKELSEIYTEKVTEVLQDDGTTKEEPTTREVFVILNGMALGTTVVPNIVYDNKIMLPFAVSNNNDELNAAIQTANTESIILNAGITPITYNFNEEVVQSTITLETVLSYISVIFLIFVVLYLFIIIRFRAKGFISMYFQIGYIAVLLLIVRLTNVILTVEGLTGIIIAALLNYIFNYIILKNINDKDMYKNSNLSFLFHTLPIYIISVVFTFSTKANISSFGMTIFWGIMMTYVYNFIFAKFIYENLTGGKDENIQNNS